MRRVRTLGLARGLERLEAFTDAVFAIAITLLILELQAPHAAHGQSHFDLWAALRALWPQYMAFGFSALAIGVYWLHHHYMGGIYVKADHVFSLLNLAFMLTIAIIPFPVRVYMENMGDPTARGPAATFLTFTLVAPSVAWLGKWFYGAAQGRLLDPRLDPRFLRRLSLRFSVTTGAYVAAALISLWWPLTGLGVAALLTALFLLPPPVPEMLPHSEGEHGPGREHGHEHYAHERPPGPPSAR
ncbi:TMEM175 family protein [Caulobacter sp. 17J80-11]|uniref:TMEM175 family protein n=1 Tax=Caulobacter sp. 17J80-11 TaxID=2763502 RepID=UPI00165395D1|nr:TMEM175 family protein [Caulobacter sp. 17J80-11]MBC6982941.1 DUF1211 domain-containing protein [Caulobacter sp. 17J80-11]